MNELDARGLSCPEPVIMIKNAVDAAKVNGQIPGGASFTILVDNRTSVENITRFGEHSGLSESSEKNGDDFSVTLKKA